MAYHGVSLQLPIGSIGIGGMLEGSEWKAVRNVVSNSKTNTQTTTKKMHLTTVTATATYIISTYIHLIFLSRFFWPILGGFLPKKILIHHLLDYLFDLFQRLRGAPLEPSWSEPAGIFEIKDGTKITQTKTIDLQKDLYTLIRFF